MAFHHNFLGETWNCSWINCEFCPPKSVLELENDNNLSMRHEKEQKDCQNNLRRYLELKCCEALEEERARTISSEDLFTIIDYNSDVI